MRASSGCVSRTTARLLTRTSNDKLQPSQEEHVNFTWLSISKQLLNGATVEGWASLPIPRTGKGLLIMYDDWNNDVEGHRT
ncbi:hypothetical protein I7I48_02758 [Histoplasma ohiense]|nr:hypothetical protein I7I48_02758 [Histoplasma ohiense (nom. inval.)]